MTERAQQTGPGSYDWTEVEYENPAVPGDWDVLRWDSGAPMSFHGQEINRVRQDHERAGFKTQAVRCWRSGRRVIVTE